MFKAWMWKKLVEYFPIFLQGFGVTIAISLLALFLTVLISFIGGLSRCSSNKFLQRLFQAYMSLFQNTPLVVQVFFLYNVLPRLGVLLTTFEVGLLGLSLYTGAFGSAIIEASLKAIPQEQIEAAFSQGFGYLQTMFLIILPQAMKIALPPMTNQAVNLIKNSSVMAMVAGGELMYRSDSWASEMAIYGPTFLITGLLYLSLCLPLSRIVQRLERRAK
ncbi:MAG: amino acid ABC transporter permease [Sphaerochaetaceae bacterium]